MPKVSHLSGPAAIGRHPGRRSICGGRAAWFVLSKVDVPLHAPPPSAVENVQEQLASVRQAYRRLTSFQLPAEGGLMVVESVADAVHGVELVQEFALERLGLKQEVLTDSSPAAAPETLIYFSISCLRPKLLLTEMALRERLLAADLLNPVYVVPLIELCPGERTAPEMLPRVYRKVSAHSLVVCRFMKWPWTTLTEISGLADAFLGKPSEQSDVGPDYLRTRTEARRRPGDRPAGTVLARQNRGRRSCPGHGCWATALPRSLMAPDRS